MFILISSGILVLIFLCFLAVFCTERQKYNRYKKHMQILVDVKLYKPTADSTVNTQATALLKLHRADPVVRTVMIKDISFKNDLFTAASSFDKIHFDAAKPSTLSIPLRGSKLSEQQLANKNLYVRIWGTYRLRGGRISNFQANIRCNDIEQSVAENELVSSECAFS